MPPPPHHYLLEAHNHRLTPGRQGVHFQANWGQRLVRVNSYKEAVQLARCAGEDAANRRVRKAGRKAWSAVDHDHAANITEKILTDLGFDISGWVAMAGVPRNEPPEPQATRKSKRRSRATAVQLNFAFA
jgi:hypothetical protein